MTNGIIMCGKTDDVPERDDRGGFRRLPRGFHKIVQLAAVGFQRFCRD